jgi:hypothetical protein
MGFPAFRIFLWFSIALRAWAMFTENRIHDLIFFLYCVELIALAWSIHREWRLVGWKRQGAFAEGECIVCWERGPVASWSAERCCAASLCAECSSKWWKAGNDTCPHCRK